jgi:hypothetical protein
MNMKRWSLIALTLCLTAASASAHYLWIEHDGASPTAKIYFGEYGEGVKEKAGGKLDAFTALKVWGFKPGAKAAKTLPVKKMDDHFLVSKIPAGAAIFAQDVERDVVDYTKHGIGVVKPAFYARAAADPSIAPAQTLDVLPVAGSSATFRVTFKNAPLANATVSVTAPNLWMREHKTTSEGLVMVEMPWPGQYVLDVVHKEVGPGEFKGKPYEAVRHRATYTFARP